MNQHLSRLSGWIVTHPKTLLVVVAISLVMAALGLQNLWLTIDYKIYFSHDDPTRQAMESMEAVYGKESSVIIVLAPSSGDVFDTQTLDAVASLTKDAWQIPYSGRVESIANYQHSYAQGDDLIITSLFEDPQSLSSAEIHRRKAILLAEPTLRGRLVSEKAHATLLHITMNLPDNAVTQDQAIHLRRDR